MTGFIELKIKKNEAASEGTKLKVNINQILYYNGNDSKVKVWLTSGPCLESDISIGLLEQKIANAQNQTDININSLKSEGNGMAIGVVRGGMTIDRKANGSSVINIKSADTLYM